MTGEPWEDITNALASRYRRQLLIALLEHNSQADHDIDPADAVTHSEGDAEQLQTELIHKHLPKLDQLGYIDWDEARGTISKGPQWDEIAPLLTLLRDHQDELPGGLF